MPRKKRKLKLSEYKLKIRNFIPQEINLHLASTDNKKDKLYEKYIYFFFAADNEIYIHNRRVYF